MEECTDKQCMWCVYCIPIGATVNTPTCKRLFRCTQGMHDDSNKVGWIMDFSYKRKICKYFYCRVCHEKECEEKWGVGT